MSLSPTHHRQDIQGLRAIAVLLVMAYHAGLPVPGGFTGVDIFFVISGFVITGLLHRDHLAGRLRLSNFYSRRVQRILPALTVVLSGVIVASFFLQRPLGPQQATAETAMAAATFWANFQLYAHTGGYFDGPAEANPLLHMWSLSVEEQFYFVVPALLLLASRLKINWSIPLAFLGILSGFLCLYGTFYPLIPGASAALAFYASPARAWQFVIGALLALLPMGQPSPRLAPLLGYIGGILLVFSAALIDRDASFPGFVVWLPVLGTALLIFSNGLSETPIRRLLSHPISVKIGDLSYSLYLYHWPFAVFARLLFPHNTPAVVGAVLLSVFPAALSFYLLETPLRHARLSGFQTFALGLFCISLPVGLAFGLRQGAEQAWGDTVALSAHAVQAAPKGIGCEWDVKKGGQPKVCEQLQPNATQWILLAGDSHATAISPIFIEIAHDLGYHAAVASALGCPMAEIPLIDADGPRDHCKVFVDHTLDWLAEHPTALVVLANRSPVNTNPSLWFYDETSRGSLSKCAGTTFGKKAKNCISETEAVKLWETGLRKVADKIEAHHTPLFLMATVPEHQHDVMDCVKPYQVDTDCAQTPLALVEQRRRPALSVEQTLAEGDPMISFWDPLSLFCDETRCYQWKDGVFLYRDDDHLSKDGTLRLQAPLQDAIKNVMASPP